ncbi:MAG: penicillin-binding protein 2 [Desulfobacteraceae bacterium]|nr:penicillin-binding protein 2 [Desulfobacteraceae bacterium]
MGASVCIAVVFILLVFRLIYLQIIKGEEYRRFSKNNCIRLKTVKAPRGLIYDRNGVLLVDNRPSFNLKIVLEDARPLKKTINKLSELIDVPYQELWEKVNQFEQKSYYQPFVLRKNISRKQLAVVEAHNFDLPGIMIAVEPRRNYIYKKSCAHLLGYIGEVNKKELESKKYSGVTSGDSVGRYGLEKSFEELLRGSRGGRQVEVDANGRVIRILKEVDPIPGKNLYLTVDFELQHIAESMLKEKAGAVIAIDPSNGEVLAMASAPSFDQNDFIGGVSTVKWKELISDTKKPMINKAFQGEYPPGSIYKIVSAIAALEEKLIDLNTKSVCPGYYKYGNRVYRCWKKSGHGEVGIIESIEQSCDVFFYHVGEKVGVDTLAKYAKGCGLARQTGIDLANELIGLIPTSQWKLKRFGEPWQGGENLSIAIGQGYDLVTPLQMAVLMAAVGNGGVLYKPQILKLVKNSDGDVLKTTSSEITGSLPASEETLKIVKKGLFDVVQGKKGTARIVRIKGVEMAGKTGTAQVFSIKQGEEVDGDKLPYHLRDHAWFICYAPAVNPVIAVSVLIEHGQHGSSGAGPVAKAVVEKYFEIKGLMEKK